MADVTDLRVEHHRDPIGIGEDRPRLSWSQRTHDPRPRGQSAYQVRLSRRRGTGLAVTEFPRQRSAESVLVAWPDEPLHSRERCEVSVRIWNDGDAEPSDWSVPLTVEAGLLHRSDWAVDFVSPSLSQGTDAARPAFELRTRFELPAGEVDRVRLYSTAHGVYEVSLNGHRVGDDVLAPGWTSYRHRLRYQSYDITTLTAPHSNQLEVLLADGWYRGRLGFSGGVWDNYGNDIALLAQLEATMSDGTVHLLELEGGWECRLSAITRSGLYEGEEHDSTREHADGDTWSPAVILPLSSFPAELVAPTGPPVKVIETIAPLTAERRPNGRIRLDFGQNITGKLEITVAGKAGHTISLHHAEVLEHGELATRPLRGAASIDRLTLDGATRPRSWSPRFTFHGFRYAELENWPGVFEADQVRALVLHTDMERSGTFESSDALLNKLHENVVWSMRDNFLDLPTDCPQRDERLGWTGDIQVFGPTASYLYRSTGLLTSWLRDVAAEQRGSGTVPNFVPWIECGFPAEPAAAWGDVAVILPWTIYQRTGDSGVLADQYESMTGWVDQVDRLTGGTGLWNSGFQLGDWLDPAAPPERPDSSHTDRYLVATAYHAYSSRLLADAAEVLGKSEDASHYREIATRAASAFRAEYVTSTGRVVSDTETALALALVFGLLDTPDRVDRAGRRLAELVIDSGYLIRTGFVGTPLVCDALAIAGEHDVAYHLLLQTESPSWLYPITMGATTIWERWDSMLPDGSINPGEMTSFNHYSLGAVADYLHRVVGGLAPAAPGYRELSIAPRPGGGLSSARSHLLTPYGVAVSEWRREGDQLTVSVTVPPGVTAHVSLPGQEGVHSVPGGTHEFVVTSRAAADDPRPVRRFNIHSPEDRALQEREAAHGS